MKTNNSNHKFVEKLINAFIVGIAICLWAAAITYVGVLFFINF